MNILIVKLSAIGDVIHTLPSLAALRRLYPDAHITWVIEETAADLITGHPHLDRVIIFRRKSWIRSLRKIRDLGKVRLEAGNFLATLRDRRYDLVIDFHGLFKSAIVVLLSGGRRKLGYDSLQELSGLFLNEKISEDMKKHAVDRYLDFARHLGYQMPGAPDFLVAIQPENEENVRKLLKDSGIAEDEAFIAVSPTALWETKLWEDRKFAELCDRITSELGRKVILTGSAGDRSVETIRSLMKERAVDLSGKTSLKDLACLFGKAALLVTTDSGPMHLAAAVGTPVVALFGPTSPERTGPYGPGHTVIRTEISCSPCYRKECETVDCMKGIEVEAVLEKIRDQLREYSGKEKAR